MYLLGLIIVRIDGERFDKWGSERLENAIFGLFLVGLNKKSESEFDP